MTQNNRYVIGRNTAGRSVVTAREITNSQSSPGYFWRSTLWATSDFPPDNVSDTDGSASVTSRAPVPGGIIFRALEIAPDDPDRTQHLSKMRELNREVGQSNEPTDSDVARHPGMHRTDTLDFVTCVSGEVYLMTDEEEVLMRPGDTAIMRGVNHAWSNRSSAPCLLTVVLVDAKNA